MKRTFFVVASGGHDTDRHYRDTIENKRSLSEVKDFLTEDQINDLRKIYKDTDFAVWGAVPGEGNIQTWHSMSQGDYVLIYRGGRIVLIGEVAYRVKTKNLAEFFWGKDNRGQTWEYIYFIINDEPLDLPVEKLSPYLGYKKNYFPRGFSGVAEEKLEKINERYGDVYDLIISLNRGYEIKEVQETHDDLGKKVADGKVDYQPVDEAKEPSAHDEIQWRLIKIGLKSGNDVWVARNDRSNIYGGEKFGDLALPELPNIGLDPDSSKTVEYIDDVWLRGRRIVAAFEVEHSSSVYSGILRLADLKVLQPNITFPLYIAAPERRRLKVFQELQRPAFSNEHLRMDRSVKFISYSKVREITESYVEKNLPVPERIFEGFAETIDG